MPPGPNRYDPLPPRAARKRKPWGNDWGGSIEREGRDAQQTLRESGIKIVPELRQHAVNE